MQVQALDGVTVQAERRDRLRSLLATMDDEELDTFSAGPAADFLPQEPTRSELFYTEGSPALRAARLQVRPSQSSQN